MKHTIVALAAAATLAAALPSSAQAHCRGCGVAAGVESNNDDFPG